MLSIPTSSCSWIHFNLFTFTFNLAPHQNTRCTKNPTMYWLKDCQGRLIIQLTYKFRVILIAFCWVFHVFRSDRWLIYVVWVIHYLIINIKRRFLQGGGDCTAGHNFSRDHKNKSAYKSTDSGQRKCTKSNKSLELPSFIWFGKASSTSESHYISMYFAFRYHTTSLLLSLSLSLSPACCLSIDITHPKRNNTVSSRALTMMHEPDGKHFSGVVIIKPFFSTGPMWKKYKDRAQSVIL